MILILPPNEYTPPLRELLFPLLPAGTRLLNPEEGLPRLEGEKLLFAVSLDEGGCNLA